MLERTSFVRDVDRTYDISIPTELRSQIRSGDHYRVYHDVDSGAIAYVPNSYPIEEKFVRNHLLSSNNKLKRKKYILRYCCDNENYLSLTSEQVDFFNWLRSHQHLDTDLELVPFDENIDWLDV